MKTQTLHFLILALTALIGLNAFAADVDEPASVIGIERRHLSEEDEQIVLRGPIPQGRYISGGITGSILGFGIGHAIQGTYRDHGWIFTAGEGASLGLMVGGFGQCFGSSRERNPCDRGSAFMAAGFIAFVGFHIWEVIDLWVTPPSINRRYEELTRNTDQKVSFRMAPILVAESTPGLGFSLEF